MATVIEQTALHYQDARSNKGFLSRLLDGEGKIVHLTAWGGVGKAFQEKQDSYTTIEAARAAHEKKVKEKASKGYQPCTLEFLGFSTEGGVSVMPDVVVKEIEWQPLLLTAIQRPQAEALVDDPAYIGQRKEDGVRSRLRATEAGEIIGYNRKGQRVAVPQVAAERARQLFEKLGPFDFDGELLGNDRYVVFDSLHDLQQSAFDRAATMLGMSVLFPAGITAVPTGLDGPGKRQLLEQAQAEGWEGLVFKQARAPYRPGRSASDFKFKQWYTGTVLLLKTNTTAKLEHGSAEMAILRGGKLVSLGNVSSGFRQGELAQLFGTARLGTHLIAEVRYLYFSEAALYQPCFLRMRDDLGIEAVEQERIFGKNGREITF